MLTGVIHQEYLSGQHKAIIFKALVCCFSAIAPRRELKKSTNFMNPVYG